MGEYRDDKDLIADIKRLRERVSALANSRGVPPYATADLPIASTVKGMIAFNTTTSKHVASDGITWHILY